MTDPAVRNPFDPDPDPERAAGPTHLVLRNDEGRYSLWPAFAEPPSGWRTAFGPAPYADCERYLDRDPDERDTEVAG
jgi:MbtH protein